MNTPRRSLPVVLALLFAAGGTGRSDDEDGLLFAPVLEIYNGAVTGPATAATYAAMAAGKPYGVLRASVRIESHIETYIEYEHTTVRSVSLLRSPSPVDPNQTEYTRVSTETTDGTVVTSTTTSEPYPHGLGSLILDCAQYDGSGRPYSGWLTTMGPSIYRARLHCGLSPSYKAAVPRSCVVEYDFGYAASRQNCGTPSWNRLTQLSTLYLNVYQSRQFGPSNHQTLDSSIMAALGYAK